MKLKLAGAMLSIAMMAVPAVGVAQDTTDKSLQTATGCLRKSEVGNVYILTDENGKTWDLRGKSAQLDPHIGHTVTVTGTIPKPSKDSADTAPQNHLVVTKLAMVRDSCKQP